MKYLWIGIGGFAGAIARYWLGLLVYDWTGTRFPYGTFVVNLTGCFLIGVLLAFLDAHAGLSPIWRLLLPTGFVGAYTTFSTFEYETLHALEAGHIGVALLNVGLSVTLGLFAVWIGVAAGKALP